MKKWGRGEEVGAGEEVLQKFKNSVSLLRKLILRLVFSKINSDYNHTVVIERNRSP